MNAPPVPTLVEVMEAHIVLANGVLAVEEGTWSPEMQEERDRARGVINLAHAAGVL